MDLDSNARSFEALDQARLRSNVRALRVRAAANFLLLSLISYSSPRGLGLMSGSLPCARCSPTCRGSKRGFVSDHGLTPGAWIVTIVHEG